MKATTPRLARRIEELLKLKRTLLARIEAKLSEKEVKEARNDHHARRKPRPCGMTIHTGIGCNLGCLYCYVPDMGFPLRPRPYPLTGLQLVYALLYNPYFVPGPSGTLLAFGSVTEPFLAETKDRAIEYLYYTYAYLGNPQQLSTKSILQGSDLDKLLKSIDPKINILITIVTLKYHRILEPRAPSPLLRLDFAKKLVEHGVSVTLFMRPIIPGITDREAEEILKKAKEHGIKTVVLGSLRVTPGILRRLGATRIIDLEEVSKRLPRRPRSNRDQVTIIENDLKEYIARKARRIGLMVLPSSCSANIWSHGLWCHACKWGPCGDPANAIRLSEEEIIEAAEVLGCSSPRVKLHNYRVLVRCRGSERHWDVLAVWLETLTRREVRVLTY